MKRLRFHVHLVVAVMLVLACTSAANAQASRTWVSGVGDDANPCSRTAPCKTFAGAISKTAAGGEIDCLDPGGFGALTITKAITIDCGSGIGSVLVSGTNGIVIAAGAGVVIIRNLRFQGLRGSPSSPGLNGISITSARDVQLENVVIQGFSQSGILVNTTAATHVTGRGVTINNCATGLTVTTSAGNAYADFTDTQISGNTTGVLGQLNSAITIRNSVISSNVTQGVTQGTGSLINLIANLLSSNGTGVQSFTGSTIRIVGNAFSENSIGVDLNSGSILSDGTNVNVGNVPLFPNGAPGMMATPILF